MKPVILKWLDEPEEHNYPASINYLSLIMPLTSAKKYVAKLRKAAVVEFNAKDIFRASGLSLLGVSNSHVVRDRKKITDGIKLSPLLLVRDTRNAKVIVGDGYHRLCAIYSFHEDALIRCKIV